MTVATRIESSQLVPVAAKAAAALRQVTGDHEPERAAGTTIGTLQSITGLVEQMAAEITALRGAAELRGTALRRIADLEVRGASELIEGGRWKALTGELQSLAQSTIDGARKPTPRAET